MKTKLMLIFLFVLSVLAIPAKAEDAGFVVIKADIYELKQLKEMTPLQELIKDATLIQQPQLITAFNKDALVEIGMQSTDGKDVDMLRLYVDVNETGQHYDLEFQLSQAETKKLSRIEQVQTNKTLYFMASLGESHNIVKLHTQSFDTLEAAKKALN